MKYYEAKDLMKYSALSRDGVKKRLYRNDPKIWGAKKRNGKWTVSQAMFEKYWMGKVPRGNGLSLDERVKKWVKENKKRKQSTTD